MAAPVVSSAPAAYSVCYVGVDPDTQTLALSWHKEPAYSSRSLKIQVLEKDKTELEAWVVEELIVELLRKYKGDVKAIDAVLALCDDRR